MSKEGLEEDDIEGLQVRLRRLCCQHCDGHRHMCGV
jgi:hypothetical protein